MNRYFRALAEVASTLPFRLPEIVAKLLLYRVRHGMGPEVFFLFDLHNRPRTSWSAYTGPDLGVMREINTSGGDFILTHDKLITSEKLAEASVSHAPIAAVAGRNTSKHSCSSSWNLLHNPEQIALFLDSPDCPNELFCKPARGLRGIGALLATREGAQWSVDSQLMDRDTFANHLLDQSNDYGLLMQPKMVNHPSIRLLTGNTGLSTLRVVTAVIDGEATIVTATQKLMGGNSLGDGFLNGSGGNLIAPIEMTSGKLDSAYGKRLESQFLLDRFNTCPGSDEVIEGFRIPMWEDALEAARAAALKLREEPLLGFDIAITEQGPVILEANPAPSWTLHQITLQMGGKDIFREVISNLDLPASKRNRALERLEAA